jgi:hypothetical protein
MNMSLYVDRLYLDQLKLPTYDIRPWKFVLTFYVIIIRRCTSYPHLCQTRTLPLFIYHSLLSVLDFSPSLLPLRLFTCIRSRSLFVGICFSFLRRWQRFND